jgi:hypothetical protein
MSTFSISLALRAVQEILEAGAFVGQGGVFVVPHHAPPPFGDALDDGDEPPERWCRIASLAPTPLPSRSGGHDAEHMSIALTVSVGAAAEVQRADPRRIERDADAVADALRGAQLAVEGQTVTIHRAMAQAAPDDGSHEGNRLFIVSATGRAVRPA